MAKRILAIDDSPTLRKLLSFYLTRKGYNVSVANDGKAGMDLFLKEKFDLIILDMEMPVMKGAEVLKKLKEIEGFSIPVLILSADKDEERMAKAIALGASFYLTKPFKPEVVVSRIEEIFQQEARKAG